MTLQKWMFGPIRGFRVSTGLSCRALRAFTGNEYGHGGGGVLDAVLLA